MDKTSYLVNKKFTKFTKSKKKTGLHPLSRKYIFGETAFGY